ncbi:T6SS effector BTH_I2691 family protein [Chitinimonas taiwanensis]|uniref:Toxin VasX N-terminal region domain-containing protein n=1 Tax=Chitinimonas taiwanensis DSM 18899 TaxID=1121279 RepID=A0A1K2HDV2_9NEIS|nr:T6SS effector BTH_I2691 family protein [Chitinimonas taiwanensis]SFZ74943.1 hypothetical protein SAMN02745887_01398 [Chitinimonas taiwanensis DSM 18899]
MSNEKICEKTCDFCAKEGLPILPVRYAIAPDEAKAPKLSGLLEVKDADGKDIPLHGQAHYSTRLLRSGYLYVFDEARKRWDAYFVTAGGYFLPFDLRLPIPAVEKGREPCDAQGHREVASCITISSPKQATKVWMGFSDVEWTPAVLEMHAKPEYRKKHMRVFDVAAWLNTKEAKHATNIGKVAQTVCEYNGLALAQAFAYSPVPFVSRKPKAPLLINTANALSPGKGVVLALNDPAGIAMELSGLMSYRLNQFSNDPKHKRPLAVSNAIASLRQNIEKQGELEELKAAEQIQAQLLGDSYGTILWTESGKKLYEQADDVSAAQLDRARISAWNKYKEKYDEDARANFQKKFDAELRAFDDQKIAPLAVAHAEWMKSKRLAASFQGNFDAKDANSGVVYTECLSLCLGATQDKKACFDLYSEWLDGDLNDKSNLILRALLLNLDNAAEIVTKGTQVSVDPRGLPWDGMIGNVGKAMDHVLAGKPDILGKLITQLLGPFAKKLNSAAESGKLTRALVAAGVIAKSPIVPITVTGKLRDFQAEVLKQLLVARGETIPPHGMKAAIARELQLMEIRGAKLNGSSNKRFMVLIDLDTLKGVPANANQKAMAQALAKALVPVADMEKLELGRWRTSLAKGITRSKTASPFAFGALGAVAQWVALGKLSEDLDKAKKSKKGEFEAGFRYAAGWLAFGGTVAEQLGNALQKVPEVSLKYGKGLAKWAAEWLPRLGKFVGVVGAGIMAIWDVNTGISEWKEGNHGMAGAYFLAAAFGFGGAMVMLWAGAAATVIGLVLVICAILLSILIEFFKDNPLQDWLERSYFGRLENERFSSVDIEMAKLEEVVA